MNEHELTVVLTPATIAKLELGPDDVVVVRSTGNLSAERAQQVGDTVKEAVGDHKVLLIAPNISLEVIARKGDS